MITGGRLFRRMENKYMEEKLKACPFCGSDKLKIDKTSRNGRSTYSVRCNSCHARGGTCGFTRTTFESIRYNPITNGDPAEDMYAAVKAIEAWNRRVE